MEAFSMEEEAAVVALLGGKRLRDDDSPDLGGEAMDAKHARLEDPEETDPLQLLAQAHRENEDKGLKPFPFFYYDDFSTEIDPDPLTPLTPPGRVPTFPAKLHAILSRADLTDVISWMPHGRSWRVLKPREFEVKVIPRFFEHAKFSSFIRQANGWGFRRVTQGRDRNSYYHPMFLRGLPHLCKKMKRPGVSEKLAADPDHEPDLYKVSVHHPVPEKAGDDSIMLQCTVEGGPKARMPIYSGALFSANKSAGYVNSSNTAKPTPRDMHTIDAFQLSLGASENLFKNSHMAGTSPTDIEPVALPENSLLTPTPLTLPSSMGQKGVSPLAMANQLAFAQPNISAAIQASSAASQFAAGFAAATALSHQQFQAMLGSLAAGMPAGMEAAMSQQPQAVATAAAAAAAATQQPAVHAQAPGQGSAF